MVDFGSELGPLVEFGFWEVVCAFGAVGPRVWFMVMDFAGFLAPFALYGRGIVRFWCFGPFWLFGNLFGHGRGRDDDGSCDGPFFGNGRLEPGLGPPLGLQRGAHGADPQGGRFFGARLAGSRLARPPPAPSPIVCQRSPARSSIGGHFGGFTRAATLFQPRPGRAAGFDQGTPRFH